MEARSEERGPFATSLIGSWKLTYRADHTASGEPRPEPSLGEAPIGLLVYDAGGHFTAQFMKRNRAGGETDVSSGVSGHNNSRAVNGYDAYFGRYTVDEESQLVTQTLEGALSADNVGLVVTRRMEVQGDELTLRLPTTSLSGESVVRTLKWERVA